MHGQTMDRYTRKLWCVLMPNKDCVFLNESYELKPMNPFMSGASCGFHQGNLPAYFYPSIYEDEIRRLNEHQHELRRKRKQLIVEQLHQVHNRVRQLLDLKGNRNAQGPAVAPLLSGRSEGEESSVGWLLRRLIVQNEELKATMMNQIIASSKVSSSAVCADRSHGSTSPMAGDQAHWSAWDEPSATSRLVLAENTSSVAQVNPLNPQSKFELPEVGWSGKDEELLKRLLGGETSTRSYPVEELNQLRTVQSGEGNPPGFLEKKQQQQDDRRNSRRKNAQVLYTSGFSNNAGMMRPRWRIEQDINDGVIRPFGEGATVEQQMGPHHIFRSVFIVVLMVVELKRLLHEKKLRLREKIMQDLKPMFEIYFDATRAWLGRAAKTTLLSIVKDTNLDIDVAIKAGLFHGSNGISRVFKRGVSAAVQPAVTSIESKLVKLKVRVKSIVEGIARDVDKGDVPSGIMGFCKRLTCNGIYFPSTYPLFPTEKQALQLDLYGATCSMQDDYTSIPGRSYPRFQVVLVNFVVVRILIPYVIMRPWDVGIGGKNPSRAAMANLKNVASVLYAIASRLSPLPPVEGGLHAGVRTSTKRTSSVPISEQESLELAGVSRDFVDNGTSEQRFLLLTEIQRLLVPDKSLPLQELEDFIEDQQQRLRDAVAMLRRKINEKNLNGRGSIQTQTAFFLQ